MWKSVRNNGFLEDKYLLTAQVFFCKMLKWRDTTWALKSKFIEGKYTVYEDIEKPFVEISSAHLRNSLWEWT